MLPAPGMAKEEQLEPNEHRSRPDQPLGVRRVTEADADRITELFALAFYDDPNLELGVPRSGAAYGPASVALGPGSPQRTPVRMGVDDRRRRRGIGVDTARRA